MIKKRVQFKNRNGYLLTGLMQLPPKPRAYSIFAHCFTCSKNLKAINHISNKLVSKGIAVLKFDFTGLGESEGEFPDTNFNSNIEDVHAAGEFLNNHYKPPSILVGHSLGGAAMLHAAPDIDSCKAVVTIGSPSSSTHLIKHFVDHEEEIEKTGKARINIGGRSFSIKKQLIDDLKDHNVLERVRELNKALLILHAPFDNIVGIDNAGKIFAAAKHPKSFVSLDDADHLLSDKDDSEYAGSVIASWAQRYIDKEFQYKNNLDKGQVEVVTYESGYFSDIYTNNHHLIADEPESLGGTDMGPTPYDLLLSSLGTCTNITLRMYADRKKIPLSKILTTLNHEKIHLEDCKDCEESTGKADLINREIKLEGELSESQIKRLLEIADKCPVHKTLDSEIRIETKLKN